VIRPGGLDDLVDLLDMEKAASTTGLVHVFGSDLPFPAADVLARWRLVLEDPSVTVLIDVDDDGAAVGYAAFGDGWLRHFGVVPRLWGSGRAVPLHDAVLAGFAEQGVRTSYLWVLVDNHRARSFYTRLGWRETGVREREVFEPYPEKMQLVRTLESED
jgi:RimJ/RimL family protein N-acetyltransferase